MKVVLALEGLNLYMPDDLLYENCLDLIYLGK